MKQDAKLDLQFRTGWWARVLVFLLGLLLMGMEKGCFFLEDKPPHPKSADCPPGQLRSNGQCHDRGKGRDSVKKAKRKKGKTRGVRKRGGKPHNKR